MSGVMDRRAALVGLVGASLAGVVPAPAPASEATVSTTVEIGISSFNVLHSLSLSAAKADATFLTGRSGIDIIGWQECDGHPDLYSTGLPAGWTSHIGTRAYKELSLSWRSGQFNLVSAGQHLMHTGIAGKFPNRYVLTPRTPSSTCRNCTT